MDGFGAYFGDNSVDTITKTGVPLTYIIPQVQNLNNNIITDTLNWTLITGTFVASGNEKHLIIGNFKSDVATNTVLINPNNPPLVATDVCIDDVSCVAIDLPAHAGNDTSCIPGTSVYIGRPQDVGIDEACIWYKLPNITTAIDTAAGLWVSPLVTTTYVVRQEICGNVKWDTVVVHQTAVGLNESYLLNENLKVYPIPAQDKITLQFSIPNIEDQFKQIIIYNSLGQTVKEEEIGFKNRTATILTNDLKNGVFILELRSSHSEKITKRFIIANY